MSPSSHHVPTASTPTGREPPPNDELPTVAPSHDPRPCRMTWRRASRSAWEKLAISAYWLAPAASPSSPRQRRPRGANHDPLADASTLCRPLSKWRYVPRTFANAALPSTNTPRPPPRLHTRAPRTPSSVTVARRQRTEERRSLYAVSPTKERSADANNVMSPSSHHVP